MYQGFDEGVRGGEGFNEDIIRLDYTPTIRCNFDEEVNPNEIDVELGTTTAVGSARHQ